MPLILKLIGQFQNRKIYEIKDSFEGTVGFRLLVELFTFWGLTPDEVNKIKFISDSEQIKESSKNFHVGTGNSMIVFVFTTDTELKNKLVEIFMKEGNEVVQNSSAPQIKPQLESPDPEICKPITIKESINIPKLSSELIDVVNAKSVSLFADPDFKSLISIYIRRPELFNTLAKYVQHGNIIEESLGPVKTIDELSNTELEHYQKLADKINHLGISVPHETIMNRLIKMSGHLNLTVRSILCDYAKETAAVAETNKA
jgi:hypothetical protein